MGPLLGRCAATAALLGSAVAIGVAPTLMPPGYSWVHHSISESAALGLQGAWAARSGFLLMALGTWLVAGVAASRLGPGRPAIRLFALMLVGTAAFSHRPFLADVPADLVEDLLHSVTATTMGFAFVAGVALAVLGRPPRPSWPRLPGDWPHLVAVVAATAIPLGMALAPDLAGLLQRGMFLVAYAWFLTVLWTPTSADSGGTSLNTRLVS